MFLILIYFIVCFKNCESIAGTCFCAGKGEGFQKQKVLYCFGEVFTCLVLAVQHQPAMWCDGEIGVPAVMERRQIMLGLSANCL